MTPFLGIFKKELKVAFTTPVAYVVFFLFALISSAIFWSQLRDYERLVQRSKHIEDAEFLAQLNFNDVILTELFVNVEIIFIFLLPILTMRVFAEERKQKTMELLMTTPITTGTVVFGKYAAMLVVLVCLIALLFVYPIILTMFGESSINASVVDWNTCLLGMLGVFLCSVTFSAVGFAFSSFTDSQIVAALLTFFLLLLLWFLGGASATVHGVVGDVLGFLSPLNHIQNFAKGVLHIGDVVYYLSMATLFLVVAYRAVEGQKWA